MRLARNTALSILLSLAGGSIAASATIPTDQLSSRLESSHLELERAVEVEDLRLNTGMAVLEIRQGILVPATAVGERSAEIVFVGEAVLSLDPPDPVENQQLELFTGSEALEETISEAVLVVTLDAAADAFLNRPALGQLESSQATRFQGLFDRWRASPERKLLNVDGALIADALEDPFSEGYFAGWLHGAEIGDFLYLEEPREPEQVTLGQFVEIEATEKERRKIKRDLHKQQRRGRLMGVEVADLGTWDTWISSTRRGADGTPRQGIRAFESKHYEIEATLTRPDLEIEGRARIHLTPVSDIGRIVQLSLHSDLQVTDVRDSAGKDLFFHQQGSEILAVFAEPPAKDSEVIVDVGYRGRILEKFEGKTYFLVNTTHWYPHAGRADISTYDLTLRWPDRFDVLASGEKVDGGVQGGEQWTRHRLTTPTFAVSFELGRFRTLTRQAGHVAVSLSLDTEAKSILRENQEELLETLADTITFFEESFGPFPLDQLTAVTTPRAFSQSLFGFVTLSTLMMMDEGGWMSYLFGFEDPRTVIAHEVAHQWWGHIVAMDGYREEWISESMANYAAVLYGRKRLAPNRPSLVGPTTGWRSEMAQTTEDGRVYESLGPITLGQRLNSSIAAAHTSLVYKKGAVVLDMLSRFFGEERFLEILTAVAGHVKHRPISTETFLTLVERLSGTDLESFANQFIYGTGLPEVYYNYAIEQEKDVWKIRLSTRQQSPVRFTYRAIDRDGKLDVERHAEERIAVADSKLAVPIRIIAFDPSREKADRKKPKKERGTMLPGYVPFLTHRTLEGEETKLELAMKIEPKEIVLDPDEEVFGTFLNERRHPKRMLYYQAWDQLALKKHDEAEATFRQALTAKVFTSSSDSAKTDTKDLQREGRRLDVSILRGLAEIHLDRGDLAEARQELSKADDLVDRSTPNWVRNRVRSTRAREALLSGDPDSAFKLIKKASTYRGRLISGARNSLLLAIAAQQTGRKDDFEEALKRAESKGADVTLLQQL